MEILRVVIENVKRQLDICLAFTSVIFLLQCYDTMNQYSFHKQIVGCHKNIHNLRLITIYRNFYCKRWILNFFICISKFLSLERYATKEFFKRICANCVEEHKFWWRNNSNLPKFSFVHSSFWIPCIYLYLEFYFTYKRYEQKTWLPKYRGS